ncbi:MAG: 1-acyl-sn-glycerol-3-phosphate acyltransferase, partial [Chitinophagia bacterium]|nr:1-acyl-sn-glycerol-3-phosphate acyltransferase [Chitinophagia bacterium]
IFNTGKILPGNKLFWLWPRRIHIHFLEPIPTVGYELGDAGKLKEHVHALMSSYFMANKDLL